MFRYTHALFGLAILFSVAPAAAEDVTEEQILRALSPQKTRSLSMGLPTPPQAEVTFVDTLRNTTSGTLTAEERGKLKVVAADKPAIDLSMEFDFRSDILRGNARQQADKLGRVISQNFPDQTFVIAGHTDAKGSEESNQKLSERRAEAVKRYLVEQHKVPAGNLIAVGYGKSRLLPNVDPMAAQNRRVQAVNMLQAKTAGR